MVCRLSRAAMVVHYESSKILAIKTREEEIGTQPTHKNYGILPSPFSFQTQLYTYKIYASILQIKKITYRACFSTGKGFQRAKDNGQSRPPDKSVQWKTIFFISIPKHVLLVLKRTVLMRRFF